jgi:hypothetical protein
MPEPPASHADLRDRPLFARVVITIRPERFVAVLGGAIRRPLPAR